MLMSSQPSSVSKETLVTRHDAPLKGATPDAKPRLFFLITEDSYFWTHRLDLARAARDAGMDVHIVTRIREHGKRITDEGFTLVPIPFVRSGRQPFGELLAVLKLARLYRRLQPDLVHHVAMKPILYGSWAARLAGVPAVVNAFAGLGYVFIEQNWKARLLRAGVKMGMRSALALRNARVILQNDADCNRLIHEKVVRREQVAMIRGSGVDLQAFHPETEGTREMPVIVLGARMLWHKGIGEFVEAARILRKQGVRARCVLVGKADPDNPASLSDEQLARWHEEGIVEWWGHREDMPHVLMHADVVVLPSYAEGLPKILLEACACGKPVVATSVDGCREIIKDEENGLLVPPKDAAALASAMIRLVSDAELRRRMGQRGREIVARAYSKEQVARETLAVYTELLARKGRFASSNGRLTMPSSSTARVHIAHESRSDVMPSQIPVPPGSPIVKRTLDLCGSLLGLIVLAPLFALVAALIKIDSSGPVFFRQERIGKNFRPFMIYKLRTMVRDAPRRGGTVTTTQDPRITKLGAILRDTKLDELPQLINVLKGEMSLVGPRPEVQEYVQMFKTQYATVLSIRPGMTDLASLKYRHEAEILSWAADPEEEYVRHILPDKLRLAEEYVRRSCLGLDLALIFKTFLKLIPHGKPTAVSYSRDSSIS
jgi:lipopolysaccharide/colanic/teichoic acid biosynthesis glycosyltransferase/glycosyltransferase involved in cell wall biosynthesis